MNLLSFIHRHFVGSQKKNRADRRRIEKEERQAIHKDFVASKMKAWNDTRKHNRDAGRTQRPPAKIIRCRMSKSAKRRRKNK